MLIANFLSTVRYIVCDIFAYVWVKVTYIYSTALCLCMCLCRPRSHWSKLWHTHKYVRSSCGYALLISLDFSLANAYAYAYAFVLVKTSLICWVFYFWGAPEVGYCQKKNVHGEGNLKNILQTGKIQLPTLFGFENKFTLIFRINRILLRRLKWDLPWNLFENFWLRNFKR